MAAAEVNDDVQRSCERLTLSAGADAAVGSST